MRAEKQNCEIAAPVLTEDGLKFDSGGLTGGQAKEKRKKNKFHNLQFNKNYSWISKKLSNN